MSASSSWLLSSSLSCLFIVVLITIATQTLTKAGVSSLVDERHLNLIRAMHRMARFVGI